MQAAEGEQGEVGGDEREGKSWIESGRGREGDPQIKKKTYRFRERGSNREKEDDGN